MLKSIARIALCLSLVACNEDDGVRFAFVTNGVDQFWTLAEAGTRAAAAEFGVTCDVRKPGVAAEQQRVLEDLVARGVDGIAVSPIDPSNQVHLINTISEAAVVITHDSDAPDSWRRCFIGVDNYRAGRMAGRLVARALPDGGTVMLFVGRLEQDNARLRRQGLIDELMGRELDPKRSDPTGKPVESDRYTVLDTRTDQFDKGAAKRNAEDALALYPDLGCMVGLFAYNTPACLEALRGAGRLGKVAVVGFDEHAETLQGVVDGHVLGTVVQDPYRYGYESVRILKGLVDGDDSVVPAGQFFEVPAREIDATNVAAFREELEQRVAAGRD